MSPPFLWKAHLFNQNNTKQQHEDQNLPPPSRDSPEDIDSIENVKSKTNITGQSNNGTPITQYLVKQVKGVIDSNNDMDKYIDKCPNWKQEQCQVVVGLLEDSVKAILDISCGPGTWTMEMANEFLDATITAIQEWKLNLEKISNHKYVGSYIVGRCQEHLSDLPTELFFESEESAESIIESSESKSYKNVKFGSSESDVSDDSHSPKRQKVARMTGRFTNSKKPVADWNDKKLLKVKLDKFDGKYIIVNNVDDTADVTKSTKSSLKTLIQRFRLRRLNHIDDDLNSFEYADSTHSFNALIDEFYPTMMKEKSRNHEYIWDMMRFW
ncbi:hypothetical protein BGX27_005822 [Mortierella sp. AM989]|nr:hypothetical protein BGX27_005822 [Mortierella sp. AM989]